MAVDDVYQVTMVFHDSGLVKDYTSGFQVRQAGASFDFNDIGDACVSFWDDVIGSAAIKSYYDADLALQEVKVRRVKPLEDVVQLYTTGLPIAGTAATDRLAPEDAVLMSHRTALIGRSNRGRTYLPFPDEGAEDASGWLTGGAVQDFADAWAGSIGQLGGVGTLLPQCVYSRLNDVSHDVTVSYCDRHFRSQRRRNVRAPQYFSPS